MRTFIVDAFTDAPFKGNPAGVCLVESPLSDETMLHIAQELNLSETAFIRQLDVPSAYAIRYVSPKMEIPLCGHATLASSKVLFATQDLNEIQFTTGHGVELAIRSAGTQIEMAFPVYETHPASAPTALLQALGLDAIENAVFNKETEILLLEIASSKTLAELVPDFAALIHSHGGINGVLVTAPSDSDDFDFHSRYFWPWSGTNEDPVTGATHTFLAPYWSERLGKTRMRSFQASARTGFMEVELAKNGLVIRGGAVIVFEGRLRAPLA